MAGATIDHLVSVTVFLAAILLFIGLFNQTIQTGVTYQHNRAVASKCSDLIDNTLLNPGIPADWGQSGVSPTGFGLQEVEFTQYQLSSFSLMRLQSSVGNPVNYSMTGQTYSNITMGFGQSLLVPYTQAVNYSLASKLLGVNESYGFSLTLTPIVNVNISLTQQNPLSFSLTAWGPGFPLANAKIDYCLITVEGKDEGSYPAYDSVNGSVPTDNAGSAALAFSGVNGNQESYALIAYAHLSGLVGVGYYEHVVHDASYVVPFISNFATGEVNLAHSWDVLGDESADSAAIKYNATFVVVAEDFTLREMPLNNETGSVVGLLNSGQDPDHAYDTLMIDTFSPGILVITYCKSAVETGIVVMPWGLSSLGFPITFGGDPNNRDWVATDIRQVLVNGIAYQAKLSVWSLEGYQVITT